MQTQCIIYFIILKTKNFRKTTVSFWNYYPSKLKSGYDNEDNERERIFYQIKDSENFKYKTKLVCNLRDPADLANGNDAETELEDIKIIVPLKNLSDFIFSLNFLMINTGIELILKWSQNFILTEKAERTEKAETSARPNNVPRRQDAVHAINRPKDLKFNITDCSDFTRKVRKQII